MNLRIVLSAALLGLLGAGCSTTKIGSTPLKPAPAEIPEEQLLDVGIRVLAPGEVSPRDESKRGEAQEIREAETRFLPGHLRQTMEASSHYGNVRVMPVDMEGLDVTVTGGITRSNGEELEVWIKVRDATGEEWFSRDYRQMATPDNYTSLEPGKKDAFQDLYNQIANDIAEYKAELSPKELKRIRDAARMRFAASFAPDSFGKHIKIRHDEVEILRLPAWNDPRMKRILDMRDREFMFFDTVDSHYHALYLRMWGPYLSWRQSSCVELAAIREIEDQAFWRYVGGAAMIATAIALEIMGVENTGSLQEVLILGGGMVIVDGVNVSEQTSMHAAALEELSGSFKTEAQPIVMEVQNKVVELRGTTEEQYNRWREILRKLYEAETGQPASTPGTAPAGATP